MNRESQVEQLKKGAFDILVIGGGATGTGIALDAASRGLRAALVERFDFSSGTSSKSTKLIHGGVRYLERAVLRFDRSQFRLVRDALHERSTLLKIAPHLVHPLAILTPLYHWMEVPYYTTGLRLYDRLAGKSLLSPSRFLDATAVRERMPHLGTKRLKGGVLYYDGQFDDARLNICLAVTAQEAGAVVANYVEVKNLRLVSGKVKGAHLRDTISGKEWEIEASVVVNAAGPFADQIRRMEDAEAEPMLTASSGTHIVLPKKYSPPDMGLLVPKTDDGRVLFFCPGLAIR